MRNYAKNRHPLPSLVYVKETVIRKKTTVSLAVEMHNGKLCLNKPYTGQAQVLALNGSLLKI
jgi:hypothetical protein